MVSEDETQCEEADNMIDANEFSNSQREDRYANQQTNKKLKADAIKKAQLDKKNYREHKKKWTSAKT